MRLRQQERNELERWANEMKQTPVSWEEGPTALQGGRSPEVGAGWRGPLEEGKERG